MALCSAKNTPSKQNSCYYSGEWVPMLRQQTKNEPEEVRGEDIRKEVEPTSRDLAQLGSYVLPSSHYITGKALSLSPSLFRAEGEFPRGLEFLISGLCTAYFQGRFLRIHNYIEGTQRQAKVKKSA